VGFPGAYLEIEIVLAVVDSHGQLRIGFYSS
jgi:hypothetical protein